MKKSFVCVVFLMALQSHPFAATPTPLGFTCVTDPPSTTFAATTQGDEVRLSVLHNFGTDYMPVTNGETLTPADLAGVNARAQALSKLGPVWNFSWKASDCVLTAPGLFQCENGEPATINGVAVLPDTLYSSRFEQDWPGGVSSKGFRISLMLEIGGQTYTIGLPYQESDCSGL